MLAFEPYPWHPSRRALAIGLLAFVGATVSSPARADDDAVALRNLATSSDYRVRVLAALALGKSRSAAARPALEKALADVSPAVRVAVGAALGSLGDPRAVRALRAALANETVVNARQEYEKSIQQLVPVSVGRPKYLVALGKLENKSPIASPVLALALKDATRARMSQVPGVELVPEGANVGNIGRSRGLPAFQVDGQLTDLSEKQDGRDVGFAARVEYTIRRMPDNALKATVTGMAKLLARAADVKGPREIQQLQMDSLTAAVDSALKGVAPALATSGR